MPAKTLIEDWRDLIEQGQRYKETYGNSKRWSTYRDYGRGKFTGYTNDTKGILPYNLVYAMEKATVPNVYFRNPYVTATPRYQPGFQMHAKVIESIDNWLIQELAIKQSMKTAVRDAYYTNRGILKTGYDALGGGTQLAELGINQKIADIMKTPISQLGKKRGERVDYNVNVKPGMPWAARVMPDYIIVPYGIRTLDDCSWIDHVIIRDLKDVKNDPMYKNTGKLEGTHMELMTKDVNADFYREMGKYTNLVEIHEIRDFKRREIKAFVPGYEHWIRPPEEDIMQVEGLPYVDFTFNEDTEYYWGSSDVQIIEPQQLEVNEARTQAMYHRRIALLKFLYEDKIIDDTEMDKLLSENVGPGIKCKGSVKEAVQILQPHIPPDLVQWTDTIRSDVRELLGHSRQSMGEAPPGRRTKFEMQGVFAGKEIRMDERRDIVGDSLIKLMRKINQIIFTKWDKEKVAQVVGYDGARYWVEYNAKAIRGEYTLRVDIESMTPQTKAVKKREIVEIIQALAKNPRANIDYLMRMLLREYEWMDAMQILPEAEETMEKPMEFNQFQSFQNKMAGNKEMLQGRASNNAEMIGRFF